LSLRYSTFQRTSVSRLSSPPGCAPTEKEEEEEEDKEGKEEEEDATATAGEKKRRWFVDTWMAG
jgi:hypothetical protein